MEDHILNDLAPVLVLFILTLIAIGMNRPTTRPK